MHLKKMTVAGCAVLSMCAMTASTAVADGLTLSVSRIQQRYPWNGLVDIDYTVDLGSGKPLGPDDNLEVLFINKSQTPAVTNRAHSFLQAPLPLSAGTHRITWDANADGVTSRTDTASFSIRVMHYAATYMVIDVSGGPSTNLYPVSFLNGAPPNGFGADEYKGDKIVLRRIHQGSFMAGSPDNEVTRVASREKQRRAALSQPFYIGIYEVTQKQFENVMGTSENKSQHKGDKGAYRPVEYVAYNTIRGTAIPSNHTYDWPWNDDVAAASFMGKLREKCKSKGSGGDYTEPVNGFDLPTEVQWEYACRAGTTGAFNTTNRFENSAAGQQAAMALLGRYKGTVAEGKGGIFENHTIVGLYQPNQWGLYDMHGNVWEWCRDWYQDDASELKQFIDPKGADTGTSRVLRGGGWDCNVDACRTACRVWDVPSATRDYIGFRLVRNLP